MILTISLQNLRNTWSTTDHVMRTSCSNSILPRGSESGQTNAQVGVARELRTEANFAVARETEMLIRRSKFETVLSEVRSALWIHDQGNNH